MKTLLLLTFLSLFISNSYCQTTENANSFLDAAICDKITHDEKSGITFTQDELENCELKINPVDTNYTVSSFKLTIIPRDPSGNPVEYEIIGNIISEKVRTEIASNAKSVFLEYIKAKNPGGGIVMVRPIKIFVNP